VISETSAQLLVSPNNVEWARSESQIATDVLPNKGQFPASLVTVLRGLNATSVAVEADSVPVSQWQAIIDLLPEVRFDAVTGLRVKWRISKDSSELVALECVAAITDQVFVEISGSIQPGLTERSLARRISARLMELGDGLGFEVIVASGPNAARPHHRPGDRQLQENEPIIIDMGGRVEGYCGDLTRTLWLGEPDTKFKALYRAVLKAHDATKAAIRAGRPAGEVAEVADRSLHESGAGEYILHSVGHGVGLEIHESPSLRAGESTPLPLNAVVTVEPGVYLPGWGGVRVEDVVVVAEHGCRTLTTAPKLTLAE
jgi:Xaa-Pro aminopeptidase